MIIQQVVGRKAVLSSLLSHMVCLLLVLIFAIISSSGIRAEKLSQQYLRKSKASSIERRENDDVKNDVDEENHSIRNLIVGGKQADLSNYPKSIVYLSDRIDGLSCGGTLISPTIVMAAGHCEISLVSDAVFKRFHHPQDVRNEHGLGINSDNEVRIPVAAELQHPDYDSRSLVHDVMLLVLERSPNDYESIDVPYMKLHEPSDPSLDDLVEMIYAKERRKKRITELDSEELESSSNDEPSSSPKQTPLKLKAFGWGHQSRPNEDKNSKPSDSLREAKLNYVSNLDCSKQRESETLSYVGRISDDMMCTWHSLHDTCHGDSGGPVIFENPKYAGSSADIDIAKIDDRDKFIQVGIVSWGEDCADEIFPGVASRVSSSYEWIRQRVCSIDGGREDTPSSFNCEANSTYSPAPSSSPQIDAIQGRFGGFSGGSDDQSTTVDVTIEIHLDVYAKEQAWDLMESDGGEIIKTVPFGTYQHENSVKEVVQLKVGRTYDFAIYDTYGDGITNKGYYRIYYSDDNDGGTETELVGKQSFSGLEQRDTFTVSVSSLSSSSLGRIQPLPTRTIDDRSTDTTMSKEKIGSRDNRVRLPVDIIP